MYQIIRVEKVKGSLGGIQSHMNREHESRTNPDIISEKTAENVYLQETRNFDKFFKEKTEKAGVKKIRKDAVKCLDFFVSASPEFYTGKTKQEIEKYFKESLEHLHGKMGKENCMYAVIHYDENTPHLHVGYVPLNKENKLSAKSILSKVFYQKLHDDFYKDIGRNFGLERGEQSTPESKKEHLDMIDFKLQKEQEKLDKLEQKFESYKTPINERSKIIENINKNVKFDYVGGVFGLGGEKSAIIPVKFWKELEKKINGDFAEKIDQNEQIENLQFDNKILKDINEKLKQENVKLWQELEAVERQKKFLENKFDFILKYPPIDQKRIIESIKPYVEGAAERMAIEREHEKEALRSRLEGRKDERGINIPSDCKNGLKRQNKRKSGGSGMELGGGRPRSRPGRPQEPNFRGYSDAIASRQDDAVRQLEDSGKTAEDKAIEADERGLF